MAGPLDSDSTGDGVVSLPTVDLVAAIPIKGEDVGGAVTDHVDVAPLDPVVPRPAVDVVIPWPALEVVGCVVPDEPVVAAARSERLDRIKDVPRSAVRGSVLAEVCIHLLVVGDEI